MSNLTHSPAPGGLFGRRLARLGLLILPLLVVLVWQGPKTNLGGMTAPPSASSEDQGGAILWRTDFEAARKESQASGKPLLLDFTASWCPPCIMMKKSVWPDAQVSANVNGGYIPVLVDVDVPANAALAQRFEVNGIPDVMVVDASGRVLRRAHAMSRDEMLAFLGVIATP